MADKELLAYLERFISVERKERFQQVLAQRTRYLTIAMEDVFQLHNTSAALRSCEAFGVQELHLIESRFGRRLDRKIAMGAERWVDLYRHPDSRECLDTLKTRGYRIVATTPSPKACPLDEFSLHRPAALFFGTEKEGLSMEILEAADELLCIPMSGFTESLNVSVAASIVLYRLTSVLRKSDVPWELSEKEKLELQLKWTKRSIKSIQSILNRYEQDA